MMMISDPLSYSTNHCCPISWSKEYISYLSLRLYLPLMAPSLWISVMSSFRICIYQKQFIWYISNQSYGANSLVQFLCVTPLIDCYLLDRQTHIQMEKITVGCMSSLVDVAKWFCTQDFVFHLGIHLIN